MDRSLIPSTTRDISAEALDDQGRVRVLPAAFWAAMRPQERMLFGHLHGVYNFPTVELVDYLRTLIAGRSAIEIGAGNGVLAEALGITATDSRQQEKPRWRKIYAAEGQPTVRYGSNVVEVDAARAVRRYRPEVVIACWVTHKYNPARPWAGGNEAGVVEEDIIAGCAEYIFVGNQKVHKDKSIWLLPHEIEFPSFVYSRSMTGTPNFVATWQGGRAAG